VKGLVFTTTAQEIARIVNADPEGFVFDLNIRRYLGTRGSVNSDILATCSDESDSSLFWFLNNGITVACDTFDAVTDEYNPHVKVSNMQIVNGCQTATSLAVAAKEGKLDPKTRVLLRLYETKDIGLVGKIVLSTNSQNKINTRDLKANDPIQIDMEQAFLNKNYYYERKPRQYDNARGIDVSRIVTNEQVAQSFLAIVLKRPSDAASRKYKVWSDFYHPIFSGQIVESYLVSTLICQLTRIWLAESALADSPKEVTRRLATNGTFHIARAAAFYWVGDNEWKSEKNLRQYLHNLETAREGLAPFIEQAFNQLEVLLDNDRYILQLDIVMKQNSFDTEINRALYQSIDKPNEP
jgi:hypothetical protein